MNDDKSVKAQSGKGFQSFSPRASAWTVSNRANAVVCLSATWERRAYADDGRRAMGDCGGWRRVGVNVRRARALRLLKKVRTCN